jgi:glycosyltransferase involved in cell wall biosynthesis
MEEKIFVLVPAYNAESTLEGVFSRIPGPVREKVHRFVVVDDGSVDDTQRVIQAISTDFPSLASLRHEGNLGYGAAVKTLLDYSLRQGAGFVVLLHADGQYPPERIPEMLRPLESGEADLVQGSRMLDGGALRGGMPLYKYAANRALTFFENAAFRLRMAEYHSGYMGYSRKFLERVPFRMLSDSFHFDLEMIVMARILGFPIAQVAVPAHYGEEVSHLKPVRYGLDVLSVVCRFKRGYYHRLCGSSGGRNEIQDSKKEIRS